MKANLLVSEPSTAILVAIAASFGIPFVRQHAAERDGCRLWRRAF